MNRANTHFNILKKQIQLFIYLLTINIILIMLVLLTKKTNKINNNNNNKANTS